MKLTIEQVFDGSLEVSPSGSYNPDKINLLPHTQQYSVGSNEWDKYLGATKTSYLMPNESAPFFSTTTPCIVKVHDDLNWIFLGDNATAAATRRISLIEHTPSTNVMRPKGAITITYPVLGNKTIYSMKAHLRDYSSGSVSVTGSSVTGSNTSWITNRMSVGSRIGFGSTSSRQITNWYEIQQLNSDTTLTLSTIAPSASFETPYIIQDLILAQINRNSLSFASGGLFITKGLRPELFNFQSATLNTIPAAVATDNIRATYWLKTGQINFDDENFASAGINGMAIGPYEDSNTQYMYTVWTSGSSTVSNNGWSRITKWNMRAPLASMDNAGGQILTGSNCVRTAIQFLAGYPNITDTLAYAVTQHGSSAGVPSLFLTTFSRIFRIPIKNILSGSLNYAEDSLIEQVPGSLFTMNTSNFNRLIYAAPIDRFIWQSGNTQTFYVSQYITTPVAAERRFGSGTTQNPSTQRIGGNDKYVVYARGGATVFPFEMDGILFMHIDSSNSYNNVLYAYPYINDNAYQQSPIILPKITLSGRRRLWRVYVNSVSLTGDYLYGTPNDSYAVVYRTAGIDDNLGSWIKIPQNGDLSGIQTSTIQFGIQLRTLGVILNPARILSLGMVYEEEAELPSQYRWNFADMNLSNGTTAWIQKSLFGTAIPKHTINMYKSDTNVLVLTQTSDGTTNGTFEYFNGTWMTGIGPDVIGTRRRFVPSGSLPAGVNLYSSIVVG